jgi:YfiH family protein
MNATISTPTSAAVTAPVAIPLNLPAPFKAFFTTREGGTSRGNYDSLNMALHVGDDPRRVRENRKIALGAYGLSSAKMIVAEQVHGSEATLVDLRDAGRGSFSHADAIEGTDALVTKTAGIPLVALSADCVLLALADPQAKILAVVHAGWRGLAAGVIENTVNLMISAGAKPERMHVAGTPAIDRCCFEVGNEVAKALGEDCVVGRNGDKAHVELLTAASKRLESHGISWENTRLAPVCTCCGAEQYFSHRRTTKAGEKHCGRMALVAWMDK